jgi:HlyD family secretion protein
VISSPTKDVGGGTVLMKMADLNLVQVRTLVDETDIGKIQPGQTATVTVDAFPNRPFHGEVLKIEPQAQTEQNVTMFPVLVRIDNRQGLLRPGMNAEVEIHVGEREGVLTVPNAALRTQRDVGSAAQVLGLDPTQVQRELAEGQASLGGAAAGSGRAGGDSTRSATGGGAGSDSGAVRPRRLGARAAGPRAGGAFGGRYIVFLKRPEGPRPTWVQTGLTDGDRSEVVSGLEGTDSVLILPSQSLVQSQAEARERMNRITGGGGLPGVQQQQGAGGAGAQRAPAGGVR